MAGRSDDNNYGRHVIRGLGASTRHNALAFGYSLALTGSFGILTLSARRPHALDIFLFGIGGALSFAVATTLTTRGFRRRVREEPPIVRAVGSSLSFISISGAIASAWLIGWALGSWTAWLVGSFVASATYVLLSAFELAFARAIRPLLPVENMEEPDDADDEDAEPQ